MSKLLRAGVGREVITPPVGIRMFGYTVQDCVSESVERELTATALILTDGESKVALLACDLLMIQSPHVDRIRRKIADNLGIQDDHVLINTSHTHLGPMLPGWQEDSEDQTELQQRYLNRLEKSLVRVAGMADQDLQSARIGSGAGNAPIGINRRERLEDGRVLIGENEAGSVDHEIGVIRVDDLSGRTLATVMIAAAHTIVLGPRTSQLSPDYVGPAREIVESATGAPSLFMQGAAGNVSPRSGIGGGGAEQFEELHRTGVMLAGEVIKTWSLIRTHNRKGKRHIVQSVAAITMREYEPLPEACIDYFQVLSRSEQLAMAPVPIRNDAEKDLERYRKALAQARSSGNVGDIHVASRLVQWAQLLLRTIDQGEPLFRELKCWALRINDMGIIAVNGEPFAELALAVKAESPLTHTFFLGYSNGCLGYLPTPEAFEEGGMEVRESFQNYMLPTAFTPKWGPRVIETSKELLAMLHG